MKNFVNGKKLHVFKVPAMEESCRFQCNTLKMDPGQFRVCTGYLNSDDEHDFPSMSPPEVEYVS